MKVRKTFTPQPGIVYYPDGLIVVVNPNLSAPQQSNSNPNQAIKK